MNDDTSVDLVIVGAGPYGLAAAAQATNLGVSHRVFGTPMAFWKQSMPKGMVLRSRVDWHMDPAGERTLKRYFEANGIPSGPTAPVTLSHFLDYAEWFQREYGIECDARRVETIRPGAEAHSFSVHLDDGSIVRTRNVLCLPGLGYFRRMPPIPDGGGEPVTLMHTADFGD